MKTPSVSLLLGVSVLLLLLSGLTVSAVSLNVSPNLQQFFTRAAPVSLRCVGQTVDGWTVKRIRGGQTEQCGAAGSDFGRIDGSSCVFDLSTTSTTVYWCETSSGQSSDQVTIIVTDKDLILEIPALPVVTGSDVTLRCRRRNGDIVEAYFFIDGREDTVRRVDFKVHNIQQSHEGLYSCSNNEFGKSPESRLRVRDPPTSFDPPTTTSSTSSGPHITTTALYNDTTFNSTDATVSSSMITVPVVAALGSLGSLVLLVLLVLVVVGLVQLWRKQTGTKASSSPADVTYADVNIRQKDKRRGPAEVTYGQVVIKKQRKAGRRTEQPPDADVTYSSVRAGK